LRSGLPLPRRLAFLTAWILLASCR
jgi:hypothetical protein